MIKLSARIERWLVAGAFIISRGSKTHVDVVVVEARDGMHVGLGEGTPIYYKGESAETCLAQIADLPKDIDRHMLQIALPHGAARNAVDAALWDLAAKQAGLELWQVAGLSAPQTQQSAITISVGEPAKMEADARARADHPILKLKLSGEGDRARVAAVRRGAPKARLIVDANEAWTDRDIVAEAAALARLGVEMVEQPVKTGADHLLDGINSPIPLYADESCQDRGDLARLKGRYQGINIKLDKAGGLTEALALKAEAQAVGFEIMVGCMLSTSLGIAPAFLVAQGVQWVDLDGPELLAKDRTNGFRFETGRISPRADA